MSEPTTAPLAGKYVPRLAAVLAMVMLSGCVGHPTSDLATSSSATISPSAAFPTPAATTVEAAHPLVCSSFLAMSDGEQLAAFPTSATKYALYTSEGAWQLAEIDAYRKICPTSDGSKTLASVLAALDAYKPTCADFAALTPETRQKWYGVLADADTPTSEQLLQVCKEYNRTTISDASLEYYSDHPKVGIAWTTQSKLGYTTRMVLTVSPIRTDGAFAHPENPQFIAGSACSLDPSKDAAVPVTVKATNTTESSVSGAGYQIGYSWIVKKIPNASPTVSVEVEASFSSGAQCITTNSVGVLYNEPTMSQSSTGAWTGFVIVHNYFSPRYPKGAWQDLLMFQVQGGGPLNSVTSGDEIIRVQTSGSMSLTGTKI